jgi:hypothetical protein
MKLSLQMFGPNPGKCFLPPHPRARPGYRGE